MNIRTKKDFDNFNFWGIAGDNVKHLTTKQLNIFRDLTFNTDTFNVFYPNGMNKTELNSYFDSNIDEVANDVGGFESFEELKISNKIDRETIVSDNIKYIKTYIANAIKIVDNKYSMDSISRIIDILNIVYIDINTDEYFINAEINIHKVLKLIKEHTKYYI